MEVWLAYAFISEGIVKNVACFLYSGYTEATQIAKVACDDVNAIAVDVTHTPVQINDQYIDGKFFRDGVEIEALPSVAQQTQSNTNNIATHESAIDDLWVAVLEG